MYKHKEANVFSFLSPENNQVTMNDNNKHLQKEIDKETKKTRETPEIRQYINTVYIMIVKMDSQIAIIRVHTLSTCNHFLLTFS